MSRSLRQFPLLASVLRPGSILALGLICQSILPAPADVSGAAVDNGDGTFTYSYTIDNVGGLFDIFAFSLDFNFDATTRDWDPNDTAVGGDVIVADPGWFAQDGIPTSGLSAQDFFSITPSSDVLIGGSLGVFSFVSSIPPSTVNFVTFGPLGESDAGQTIGPGIVPESGTMLAAGVLALGCTLAAVKRRR